MKTTGERLGALLFAAALTFSTLSNYAQNVLIDPGFEYQTPTSAGGWNFLSGGVQFSTAYSHTGHWSVFDSANEYVTGTVEQFPAAPGSKWQLTGYGLSPAPLLGSPAFGLIQVSFFDISGKDLGTVETAGNQFPAKTSGQVDGTATPGMWLFLDTGTATAPADTAYIQAFTLYVDFSGFYQGVYFDDLSLTGPEPPIITCSAPLMLECENGSTVGTVQAEVEDTNGYPLQVVWTVDGKSYQTNSIPSGGTTTASNVTFTANFELGEHVVVVSASNGQTEPVACSTTVTVHDTTPPRIVRSVATPNVLWPPNHRMIPVNVTVEAVDNCDPTPVVRIISVTSNEPQNPIAPDWEITGPQSLNLRAERLGKGPGRIYTIVVDCTDLSGNISTTTVEVTVPRSLKVRRLAYPELGWL